MAARPTQKVVMLNVDNMGTTEKRLSVFLTFAVEDHTLSTYLGI